MQIVGEIRLPVSAVVNGSHHSPPLTVDRKGRNGTSVTPVPPPPLQSASDAGSSRLHGDCTPPNFSDSKILGDTDVSNSE